MRKVFIGLVALVLSLLTPIAFAAVAVNNDGTYVGEAVTLNIHGASGTATTDGSTVTITPGSAKQVNLPLTGFYVGNRESVSSTAPVVLGVASSATPYLLSTGYRTYIQYQITGVTGTNDVRRSGKDASPIVQSFRVPDDYSAGAAFVITCQNDPDAVTIVTPCYLDWDIVIVRDSVTSNGIPLGIYARDDQTPTTLPFTAGAASDTSSKVEQVTLTYATPTDISAGDVIEFRLWPAYEEDGAGSSSYSATQALRIYGVTFKYTAQF